MKQLITSISLVCKLFITTTLLSIFLPIYGQKEDVIKTNLKYGKPSQEELSLKTYVPDTTAAALVLFHTGVSEFTYSAEDGFRLRTTHNVRLKILKPEGADRANVTLPYYSPNDRMKDKDDIFNLEASAYNLENGKMVKTEMSKEFISRERVNETTKLIKFSVPAVRVGTIIEYSYTLVTDHFSQIDNWKMQEEIPVIFSQYHITVPKIFIYNIEVRGKNYIDIKEKESSIRITTKSQTSASANVLSLQSRAITFTAKNLPAIKQDEAFCWCPEDYKVQISFELQGTHFPNSEYKSYTKTWDDIDKYLLNQENGYFGKHLSLTNPFREDTKPIYSDETPFNERLSKALQLLKSKIAWNGKYQMDSNNPLKAVETRSGSNADMNFILIAMLKDLGIKSYPAVLRLRGAGVLPFTYPSIQKLNTFIVAIEKPDDSGYVFMDASMNVTAVDILPQVLLADKVRIMNPQETEEKKWANLQALTNNSTRVIIQATITPEEVKGNRIVAFMKQDVSNVLKEKYQAADNASYINQQENRLNCRISNYEFSQPDLDLVRAAESFDFTRKMDNSNSRLYINPMIFRHITENPFTQAVRELPVEFSYPSIYNISVTLKLPEGYSVEELPKSQSIQTENGGLSLKYIIQHTNNQIILQYSFHIKETIFAPQDYTQLQKVWSAAIEKNNAVIVLKKM